MWWSPTRMPRVGTLNNGYTYTVTNPAPTVTAITPNSGTANGGTPVTITGTGFLAGATVSLGGTAATGVTVVNSTSITATTAAHAAGAVSVVVTNTDAQSGTLNNGYTYTTGTGGGGTIAFVQMNAADPQTASASVPVAYLTAQTAGNLNVVAVGWNDTTSTVSSVTDTRGNTYIQAGTTTTGTGMRQAIYYARNIAAGSNTVTVAFNQAAAFVDVRVLEYSGMDTIESAGCDGGGGGNRHAAPSSGAATTTSASELIFGAGMTGGHLQCGRNRVHFAHHYQPGRRHRGRQDCERHRQLQCGGTAELFRYLDHADGDVPRQRSRHRQSGADRDVDHADSGTANGGTPVTITGTGFLRAPQ